MELGAIRSQFPALLQQVDEQPVYFFDGPGGAQVSSRVLDAMTGYLKKGNANLGGRFFSGYATDNMMANARSAAATFLHAASPENIVFGANMTLFVSA